ncbi:MAG: hypothetical protein FWH52_00205 [Synergistaceae bacterium]|nr:hypothetical protein [Synergistaceae bacterium]
MSRAAKRKISEGGWRRFWWSLIFVVSSLIVFIFADDLARDINLEAHLHPFIQKWYYVFDYHDAMEKMLRSLGNVLGAVFAVHRILLERTERQFQKNLLPAEFAKRIGFSDYRGGMFFYCFLISNLCYVYMKPICFYFMLLAEITLIAFDFKVFSGLRDKKLRERINKMLREKRKKLALSKNEKEVGHNLSWLQDVHAAILVLWSDQSADGKAVNLVLRANEKRNVINLILAYYSSLLITNKHRYLSCHSMEFSKRFLSLAEGFASDMQSNVECLPKHKISYYVNALDGLIALHSYFAIMPDKSATLNPCSAGTSNSCSDDTSDELKAWYLETVSDEKWIKENNNDFETNDILRYITLLIGVLLISLLGCAVSAEDFEFLINELKQRDANMEWQDLQNHHQYNADNQRRRSRSEAVYNALIILLLEWRIRLIYYSPSPSLQFPAELLSYYRFLIQRHDFTPLEEEDENGLILFAEWLSQRQRPVGREQDTMHFFYRLLEIIKSDVYHPFSDCPTLTSFFELIQEEIYTGR